MAWAWVAVTTSLPTYTVKAITKPWRARGMSVVGRIRGAFRMVCGEGTWMHLDERDGEIRLTKVGNILTGAGRAKMCTSLSRGTEPLAYLLQINAGCVLVGRNGGLMRMRLQSWCPLLASSVAGDSRCFGWLVFIRQLYCFLGYARLPSWLRFSLQDETCEIHCIPVSLRPGKVKEL